ncbi:MAG: hypothetical protein M1835_007502 [Candelina submexicana]|nr:MAG: hypothetical protein M1835_007502 [Candelina submexicana]
MIVMLLMLPSALAMSPWLDVLQCDQHCSFGSEYGGNVFPGVSVPFGVVKLGPDVEAGIDANSGYLPRGRVTGFSMMHESGTGGAPKYGVVSQLPIVGSIDDPLADFSSIRAKDDVASVGYYKSSLASGITVELAATAHAGFYQYTFPTEKQANVLVDVSHFLPSYRKMGTTQAYAGGNFSIFPDGRYEGSGTYNNGWDRDFESMPPKNLQAPDWTIFFCGKFDTPVRSSQIFAPGSRSLTRNGVVNTASSQGKLGGLFTFTDNRVVSRVGISFISSDKACGHVDAEIPAKTELQKVVGSTKDPWNTQVLSKITTTEKDSKNLQLLYSSLYGMHLQPSNRTGENPLWTSNEPYYDDILTLWDTHRCATPLMHILQPTVYEEFIRSMIDIYRHDGYLPDARSSNFNGRTQGGSNADNVLADAYVKGVRGAIDWKDGLKAMIKDAEIVPPNNNDPQAPGSSTKEGRGALPDWHKYGYITPTYTRSVSRAMEYSLNDFALYQVASGVGDKANATAYLKRSQNWRKHYNPDAKAHGFSGFVVPKRANGKFEKQDPLDCGGCYWKDAYYEALPYEYTFGAHHDMAHLIKLSGGAETFVKKLDKMFEKGSNPHGDARFEKTIFNPGNEPSFASPYLFNFAGRQDLSVTRSRAIARKYYAPTPGGLPGNSDAGAMQSWLLWNMIGLYPLTGQTTFLISSPWFADLTIELGGGRKLRVTSRGGERGEQVQSLKVNGKVWEKSWVGWKDVFEKGGTMEFELGREAKKWVKGEAPPSPAS